MLQTRRSANDVPVLRFAALAGEPGLVHGISTRGGGVSRGPYATLNLSLVVGERVWDIQSKFRLRLGPLSWLQFRSLMPNGDALRPLISSLG